RSWARKARCWDRNSRSSPRRRASANCASTSSGRWAVAMSPPRRPGRPIRGVLAMKPPDTTTPPAGNEAGTSRSPWPSRIAALALYWIAVGQYRESTEDAYVGGNVVSVTAQVGGVVTAIHADDTDFVQAGRSLVQLDDTDARLALARAKAQLARTVRQVRAQY